MKNEIVNIQDGIEYYYIHFENGIIHVVRKRVFNSSERPLTTDELTIGALCRKILNSLNNGINRIEEVKK